jgi:putative solute:sodium symporter small subunit
MPEPKISNPYWRANLKLVAGLLVFWALFSFVLPILFVESLNKIQIAGFPLGFWMAQQGSIVVFIVLVLVYAVAMNRIDAKYDTPDSEDD